jgi:hypothetical protein
VDRLAVPSRRASEIAGAVRGAHVAGAIEGEDGIEGGVEDGLHALRVAARDLHLAAQAGLVLPEPRTPSR